MRLFNYTKWEVLEIYNSLSILYCVQVRMNIGTGFKHFKVSRITRYSDNVGNIIDVEKINKATNPIPAG